MLLCVKIALFSQVVILDSFRYINNILLSTTLKNILFSINTDTGFCNYEKTTNLTYGNYTWTETFGGKTVITKCAFKQDSNVTRKCLPCGDGWGDIDFTACR